MFSIKVKEVFLELPKGNTFKWVKNSELFATDLPQGEYSYPIKLSLKSGATATLLQSYLQLQSVKKDKKLPCALFFQNYPIDNYARLVIRKLDKDNLQGYVLTGSSVLVNTLKNTKLNEIDLGSFDTGTGHQDMVNHMLQTVQNYQAYNHVFAPIHAPNFTEQGTIDEEAAFQDLFSGVINTFSQGQFVYKLPGVLEKVTEYVPFPKLHYIIEKVFDFLGFELDWPLMDSVYFKKIVLVNNTALKKVRGKTGFAIAGGYQEIPYSAVDMQTVTNTPNGTNIQQNPINGPYLNFNQDYSLQSFDEVLVFDLNTNAFIVQEDNMAVKLNFSISYSRFDDYSWGNQRLVFEVFLDDDFLAAKDGDWFTIDLNQKTFTDYIEFTIPANSIGKKIQFKAALVNHCINCWDSINQQGIVYDVRHTAIYNAHLYFQYQSEQVIQNLIQYHQHVANDSLSDFLNNIRKRFGAYVQNIDYANRKIVFRQLKDVFALNPTVSLFAKRNPEYKLEIERYQYTFKEDFVEDPLAKESLYLDSIGGALTIKAEEAFDDFENVEIALKYPAVFMNTTTGFLAGSTAIRPFVGFKGKLADQEGAEMRLAFYHGMQTVDDNPSSPQIPYISAYSYNSQLQNFTPYALALNADNSFFNYFLKRWYHAMTKLEVYHFDIHPNLQEIIQFQFDKIDWYQHQLFLCRKAEFNLKEKAIEKGLVELVKFFR